MVIVSASGCFAVCLVVGCYLMLLGFGLFWSSGCCLLCLFCL